jgi:hypothetical protein
MIELAYISTSSWSYSKADLDEILLKSRANNRRDGITGLLLYRGGTVLQLLEGEAVSVHSLYEKLRRDARHHSLVTLYDRPLAARKFPHWAMAFERMAEGQVFGPDVFRIFGNTVAPNFGTDSEHSRLIRSFLDHVR